MVETQNTPIEFNSMAAILQRLDKLFYAINESRGQNDYASMVEYLAQFFKEISPDMKQEESDKLWQEVLKLKRVNPINDSKKLWLNKADELDIRLRRKAKELGYLTRNQKDRGVAVIT